MDAWQRIPEEKNPNYGKRSFAFPLGSGFYKVSIDEAHPFEFLVTYQSESWTWPIEIIEQSGESFRISGMAFSAPPVLPDTYWFEFRCDKDPRITYWGDRVIFRVDHSN